MSWQQQAIEKLEQEAKGFKGNRYESAMAGAVREALEAFCRQEDEFAQAVVQGGGFKDCMAAVAKDVKGTSLSDEEAYRRAAAFYFRGADVKMEPKILLTPEEPGKVISLDLSDFFS